MLSHVMKFYLVYAKVCLLAIFETYSLYHKDIWIVFPLTAIL